MKKQVSTSQEKRCFNRFCVLTSIPVQTCLAQPPAVILRAQGGEPISSWENSSIGIFGGMKPGIHPSATDSPISANTNTSRDVSSDFDAPSGYPAYWLNGPSTQNPRIAPPQFSLDRNLIASDPISLGSFGPNQFCIWDTKLYIYSENDAGQFASKAVLFDGSISRQLLFDSEISGTLSVNATEEMTEEETREYKRIIPDPQYSIPQNDPRFGSGVVHAFFGNSTAIVEKFDGTKLYFELVQIGNFLRGRLRSIEDRLGSSIVVIYQVNANNVTSADPDAFWKILRIDDRFGGAYQFNYGTQQHSGRWCVESIDILNQGGGSVNYTYGSTSDSDPLNDGKLIGVQFADGNTATYAYGVDTDNNPTIAWSDPASVGTFGREIIAHVSGSSQTQNGELANQPSGALVKVMSKPFPGVPSETRLKVTYLTYPELLIEYGGMIVKITAGGQARYATQATDPCNNLEPVFATNTYSNTADLLQGKFTQVIDQRGQVFHYEFDPDGFPIKKTYDLGQPFETFEEWTYNQFKQASRYRDREGRVTVKIYGSNGQLLERQVGILDVNGVDVNQPEFAAYKFDYYPNGHANALMLKTVYTPMYTASPDLHRTDYVYDVYNRIKEKTGPAETTGEARPVTKYFYDIVLNSGNAIRRARLLDPLSRQTRIDFDIANRPVKVVYHDGSIETATYGIPGTGPISAAQLPTRMLNRTGDAISFTYDGEGRPRIIREASNATSLNGRRLTSFHYFPDSQLLKNFIVDSKTIRFDYDYRAREISSKVYPYTGKTLTTKREYLNNRLHFVEDPYGRRRYVAYHENNYFRRVRVLQFNRPYYQTNIPITRFDVLGLLRNSTPNAPFTVNDLVFDHSGNLVKATDGRGIDTSYTNDSRNRRLTIVEGAGVSGFNFQSVTTYNKDNTISSVTSPRYHDTNDANASQLAQLIFEYNGRTIESKRTVVQDGSNVSSIETTYLLDNRIEKEVDARGFEWSMDWHDRDARISGRKNPRGHGPILNTDSQGRVTHTAFVANYDNQTDLSNPLDADTNREFTARFDGLSRVTATTTWLAPRGTVDRNNPPLAGINGVPVNDGITTQVLYDNRIFDSIGLDSPAGVVVQQLGGGTFNVDLGPCLTKLAEPIASGGGGITFGAGRAGCAEVIINGEQEIVVEICDALDRPVMTAIIEGPDGTNPNELVTWNCVVYDTVTQLPGFGETIEIKLVDALGNYESLFIDGGGRPLQVKDELGMLTTIQFDADDQRISVRDPNGIGYDAIYDALGRMTARTDTHGDSRTWAHDRAGNVIEAIDAKNNKTINEYNAANQLIKQTNRINGVIEYTHDRAGNVLMSTDAESNPTKYVYDSVGLMSEMTLPDHVNGSVINTSGYGKVQNVFDTANRLQQRIDQTGAVVELDYDMANRIQRLDYRTAVGATIQDSDIVAYDRASRLISGTKGRFANTVLRSYDIAGRLKSETLQVAGQDYGLQYEYDLRSQLAKLIYPDGSEVEKSYTERLQLHETLYEGLVYDTRTYDDAGRPASCTYRNGVVTTDTFNSDDNFLSSITTTHPGGITAATQKVGDFSYTYDANKNKTSETITGTLGSFGFQTSQFDAEDRLVQWNRTDGNQDQSWILSLEGDWDSFSEEATTVSRIHNAVHEITSIGGQALQHDFKGNLTQNSNGDSYSWDIEDQLSGAATGGSRQSFVRV